MIFYLDCDIPKPESKKMDHESSALTAEEFRIIKRQIRKNSEIIDNFVGRLDLLVNKEGYPRQAVFIQKIRRRLMLLMEENDTFRSVLWKHYQLQELTERPAKINE